MKTRFLIAVLFAVTLGVCSGGATFAQTQTPASAPPDRTIHVSVDGVTITETDIGTLARGLYDAGRHRVDTITKKPSMMPTQFPYVYYAGRNAATGRETVWLSSALAPENDQKRSTDEYTGAYALAALDADDVGEPWKSLYHDAVTDEVSRAAFGQRIAQAFDDASNQLKSAADADVAWLRNHITVGMTRKEIYAALRPYGLVALNGAYAPGKSIGIGTMTGCDRSDEADLRAAAWPYPGEPLPKLSGGCAALEKSLGGPEKPDPFPSANMTLRSAFNIACSSDIHVEMTFGPGDTLKKFDISKPDWGCV